MRFRFQIFALVVSVLVVSALLVSGPASAQGDGSVEDKFVDVIVVLDEQFAPGSHQANKDAAAAVANSLGVSPGATYGTALFGFAGPVPVGRLVGLENDPRVDYIELDQTVTVAMIDCTDPANENHKKCQDDGGDGGGGKGGNGGGGNGGGGNGGGETTSWGYERIGAAGLTNIGAGIHVYVLDTGIDSDHPDLDDNLASPDSEHLAVTPCTGCSTLWDDDNHHGTNVAGIIGAEEGNGIGVVGIAPGVTLHSVKVLDANGSGADSGVIAGIDWIASRQLQMGVPVVANMSFETTNRAVGGTCSFSGFVPDIDVPGNADNAYHSAVCAAANLGVIFVAAAGNSGADAATVIPAAYDDAVITVSATYEPKRGNDGWSFLSNWGDDAGRSCCPNGSAPVALAAPGEEILTTWNDGGYDLNSGTSFAAPHVAGAIALYLASQPSPNTPADYTGFEEVRDALLDSAEQIQNNLSDRLAGQRNPHEEDMVDVRSY